MLESISNQEQKQLHNIKHIAQESFNDALKSILSDKHETHRKAFQAALTGIKKGEMSYENDIVKETMLSIFKEKTAKLKNLTPEEESRMLSLTAEQREQVATQDRIAKNEYLKTA